MEIVEFINHRFDEIPEQDNPALIYYDTQQGKKKDECIMIFRGRYVGFTDGGVVVALVENDTDLTKLGVFWNIEKARLFAEAIVNQTV